MVPAEVLISPGETVQFHVRAFDEQGELLGVVSDPDWDLDRLPGIIDDEGLFKSNSVKQFQAGMVSASVGGVKSAARVRVIGALPWYDSFDDYAEGSVPPTWIGAGGKYKVEEKNGNMLLTKTFRPRGLLRNALYMGPSSMTNYTIQADLMGGQKKRRKADIGLINGGYTMDLQGNRQKLQVRTWPAEERIAQDVKFEWDPNTWYRMKLRVDVTEEKAVIRGKVWPSAEREPRDWTIVVEDQHPIQGGSPGLIGYSPVDIYYDNLRVTVND